MRFNVLIVIALVFGVKLHAQSPALQWVKTTGGVYGKGVGYAIKLSTNQSFYAAGSFLGKLDFDSGAGVSYLQSAGSDDAFICKYSTSGSLIWAKQIGGTGSDAASAITADGIGNVYTTGNFSGTADFNPGAGVFNMTSSGATDIFVTKLDAAGNFLWAKKIGGVIGGVNTPEGSTAIEIDNASNVYLTGVFTGTVDFNPGSSVFNLTSAGSYDVFVLKLNASGDFVWAKKMGGALHDHCYGLALDDSANIYTTGSFKANADFNPTGGSFTMTSAGDNDIFVSKLNSSGVFVWAKQFGGSFSDQGNSITTDALGNVYFTGQFSDTADFNPGSSVFNLSSSGYFDIFISKLDLSGNMIWAKQIGGPNLETSNSIVVDGLSNVYVTGTYYGTADFDPGANVFNLTPGSLSDIFVSKLNAAGNMVWAKSVGGGGYDFGYSIAVNSSSNVFYIGSFSNQADFDPGVGIFQLDNPAYENWPVFSRLDDNGNLVWASSPGIFSTVTARNFMINSSGEFVSTGHFMGTVDFDPGNGVFNLTSSSPYERDIFVTKTDSLGNLLWVSKFSGTMDKNASDMKLDASGNIYVCGYFSGTVDFDPGPGIFNLTAASSSDDIFILKLDNTGQLSWVKRIGGTLMEEAYSLALDAVGNIYVTGYFSSTVDFDPGPGVSNLISAGGRDAFIVKFDNSGNLVWAKQTESAQSESAQSIKLDVFGNIYFVGSFSSTLDLDPGPGIFNLTSTGNTDVFISKWDNAGNFIWAKQIGGISSDGANDMYLDTASNVFVTGKFEGTVDFDPGSAAFNLTALGQNDVFLIKLDSSGNFVWANQLGGTAGEDFPHLYVDAFSRIYLTGRFSGTVDFDPGFTILNLTASGIKDMYVLKLDDSGNLVWVAQFGGEISVGPGKSCIADLSGNIYSYGTFINTVDFDPGNGIQNITATSLQDIFMMKLVECFLPSSVISTSGPTSFCAGGSVTLNAATGPGYSYQWMKNTIPITGATGSSYVATTAGNYNAVISSSISCYTTSSNIIVTVPCLPVDPNQQRLNDENGSEVKALKVYPNPTNGVFVVDSWPGMLQIFNSMGMQVGEFQIQDPLSTLDLSSLPAGPYLLKLISERSVQIQYLILSR